MNNMVKVVLCGFFLSMSALSMGQSWTSLYNQALSQFQSKDYKTAEKTLIKARMQAATEFGNNHENYRQTLSLLAETYYEAGDYRNCITNYTVVEKLIRDDRGIAGKVEHARILYKMGLAFERGGRYPDAANYYQQALDIFKKETSDTNPEYLMTLHNFAALNKLGKRFEPAMAMYDQLYTKGKGVYNAKDEEWRSILKEKAELSMAIRKNPEAILIYEEYISASKAAKAPVKDYAGAYKQIALNYRIIKDFPKVVEVYNTYLTNLESDKEIDSEFFMKELEEGIDLFDKINQPAASKKLLEKKLAVQKDKTGDRSKEYAAILVEIGKDEKASGNITNAEKLINQAMAIQKETLGEGSEEYTASLDELGKIEVAKGNDDKAEEIFLKASDLRITNLGATKSATTKGLDSLAYFYMKRNRFEEADSLLNMNLKTREESLGKGHGEYGHSLNNLATLYTLTEKYKEAEPLFKQAGRIFTSYYGSLSVENAMNVYKLADLYKASDRNSEAVRTYQSAIPLIEGTLGKDSSLVSDIQNKIKEITGGK